MIRILLVLIFAGVCIEGSAQEQSPDTGEVVKIHIDGPDTIFVHEFEEFILKDFTTPEQREQFKRLTYNVKKVLPYAKLAAFRLQMMEDNLHMLTSQKEKDQYIKATEKAMKDEFQESLKVFSRSQGMLLIKLIHRETGKTTYEILKHYRGNAETFYWGAFAKFYNASLKSEYDPILDYQIDWIIKHYNLE